MHVRVSVLPLVVLGAGVIIGALTYQITHDTRQAVVAGVTATSIGLWATGAFAEHITGLGFFVAVTVTAAAPPQVIFSGFTSNALWLVMGGLVLGVAVDRTGLAAWIAGRVFRRPGGGYARMVFTVVLGATVLGFLVPSAMARAVFFIPIVMGLADQVGLAPGRRGRVGLLVAAALASYLVPATVLPANLSNAVLIGAADTLYGVQLKYAEYLLAHFPVLGALKSILIVAVVCRLFHEPLGDVVAFGVRTPLDPRGLRCLVVVLAALILWMTDGWHGIKPGWISCAAGLACLMPGMRLVPLESFHREVSPRTLIFVAAVLGVGAVVAHSGVGDLFAVGVLDVLTLEPNTPVRSFSIISGLATVTGTFATMPGQVAILTPLAETMAAQSGLALETVLMMIAVGYSTVALPYQAAPLVFALKLGNVKFADGARATALVFLGTVGVLLPLDYLWWRAIGLL